MYRVRPEWDGCAGERDLHVGTREACITFLRKNWRKWNRGKGSLCLIGPSGRCESFIL